MKRNKLVAEKEQAQSKLKVLLDTVKAEDHREFTAEERVSVESHLAEMKDVQGQIDRLDGDMALRAEINAMAGGVAPAAPAAQHPNSGRKLSMGEQFVASDTGQWFQKTAGASRGAAWRSPSSELSAATLTEDAASGGSLVVSDYRPGILDLKFKRLTVVDLLSSGTTDSNLVSYMRELAFTNASAAVLEGGIKPESTLTFDAVSDSVRKIAHWLPVTEEMLEDVSQIRSYIDARLRLGLDLTLEDQVLNGSGTAPNIRGLLNRTGLATAVARGTDSNADAIYKQIWAIFNASFLMPDGIVINPTNWQTSALSKDANGNYLGAGPFSSIQTTSMWGLPVAVTPSIAAGTALVGSFKMAAQLFTKGGVRVEASNSHSDFFIKNLVAIRAEMRAALAVYRPGAIGTVTGLV
ncbi:MAG TPA: phage major capsid protein [Vicinamibacterales bacterium]|nr:phage major capsid protein [Vicinamibacterales bacterium]